MNKTKHILFAVGLAGLASLASCNSDDTYESEPLDFSGLAITGFSLKADRTVLNNLDSVFFSIDLVSAQIYNADSLPVGTKTNSLIVSISSDAASQMKLSFEGENGTEEIDYLSSSNATIDFSRGPVKLHMVSGDGLHERDYTIRVNVHRMAPDSLYWAEVNRAQLPGSIAAPSSQRALRMGDKAYCLTSADGGRTCSMAESANLYDNEWSSFTPSFPSQVNVRSLTATDTQLFILAADGHLLASTDGRSWSDTGEVWNSITVPYGSTLLGVKTAGGKYVHASYPASAADGAEVEDRFPLSGNAGAIALDSKWSETPQVVTVGGRDKNGRLTGATWAYDGTSWALMGDNLPAAEGYAVAEYTVCRTDTVSWRVRESDVILAIGGRNGEGTVGRDVYISYDYGLNWQKAFDELLLPKYIPAIANADLLVLSSVMPRPAQARGMAGDWTAMPVKRPLALQELPLSRGNGDWDTWECPFLYLFGGDTADGTLSPYMWRGAVNHFRFRPLW